MPPEDDCRPAGARAYKYLQTIPATIISQCRKYAQPLNLDASLASCVDHALTCPCGKCLQVLPSTAVPTGDAGVIDMMGSDDE
jgi:hypothetical protein